MNGHGSRFQLNFLVFEQSVSSIHSFSILRTVLRDGVSFLGYILLYGLFETALAVFILHNDALVISDVRASFPRKRQRTEDKG